MSIHLSELPGLPLQNFWTIKMTLGLLRVNLRSVYYAQGYLVIKKKMFLQFTKKAIPVFELFCGRNRAINRNIWKTLLPARVFHKCIKIITGKKSGDEKVRGKYYILLVASHKANSFGVWYVKEVITFCKQLGVWLIQSKGR